MPFLYRSYDQGNETGAALLVETDGNPETFTATVRRVARNIAPDVGIFGVRTMQAHFNEVGLLEVRLSAGVFTTVSAIGLILGVLGLYAVIAYSVGQRTHEIGIRMAVGASDRQVLRMVLRQGLGSSSIAAAIGICLAWALSGTIADFVSYVARIFRFRSRSISIRAAKLGPSPANCRGSSRTARANSSSVSSLISPKASRCSNAGDTMSGGGSRGLGNCTGSYFWYV